MKLILSLFFVTIATQISAGGKLIGTSGVTQVEGSAGGGLVPWATLAGYGTRDEQGASAFFSAVTVDDFRMSAYGVAFSYHDRIEASIAHQKFQSDDKSIRLSQNVLGLKVRLFGDLVYTEWPQVALGMQYKNATNLSLIKSIGGEGEHGTDFYLAATKAWLDGPFHHNFVLNTTLRYSKANQLGLQGFGGDKRNRHSWLLESSLGLFINRNWVFGVEYRQKPDNLNSLKEDDWKNLFITHLPNKAFSVTAALVDLGQLGGRNDQSGAYLSLQLIY